MNRRGHVMASKDPDYLSVSLIIPAYNEENFLPRLLDSVDRARSLYIGGEGLIETVVVDNGSSDRTVKVARERGCRIANESRRIIAAVRNKGARLATGKVLTFVDADSIIHPETFNAIEECISSGRVVAGATGVKMERMSIGIAAAYVIMVPMVWLTGMDTGVVFCSKDDFNKIGGYNEKRLFAEDVNFLWDLKKLGKSSGRKLVRLTSVKALCSTRKFDEHGEWHYVRMLLRFLFTLLFFRGSMDSFAEKYWYGQQRK
jgi:glycosyltransferase involved in cell wall biosynthesis